MDNYSLRESVIAALQRQGELKYIEQVGADVPIGRTSSALTLELKVTSEDIGEISIVTDDVGLLVELAQGEETEQTEQDVQVHLLRKNGTVLDILEQAGVEDLNKACFTLHQAIKFVIDQKLVPIKNTLITTCFVIKKGETFIMASLMLLQDNVLVAGLFPIGDGGDLLEMNEAVQYLIVVPDKKP